MAYEAKITESFTKDAIRTEPNYDLVSERLKDKRTIRLLHAAMGLATEAGEFVDMLKKHIFYGKPIDTVNAIEELGDSTWYERIACDELGIQYIEMMARNVAKLKTRFPEKFTEGLANERDIATERRILETSLDV